MHSSGSFIKTCLEKCRAYIDEPNFDAKYTQDFIVRHWLLPAMTEVVARINMTNDNPVVLRHTISIVSGTKYYTLPPSMQELWRLIQLDTDGNIIYDWKPRTEMHPCGPGWALDGNEIRFMPPPTQASTWTVEYVPNGSVGAHYADGTASTSEANQVPDSGGRAFTLATAPTLGFRDLREHAYAGQIFRYISTAAGAVWQERVIDTYDSASRTIVLRKAISGDDLTDGFAYEIAPPLHYSLWEAVACRTAMKMGVARRISKIHMDSIQKEYMAALKTIRDQYANYQLRAAKYFRKDTIDNNPTSV